MRILNRTAADSGELRDAPPILPANGSRAGLRLRRLLLLAAVLLASAAAPRDIRAESAQAGEYQVKAAFIINFANFIEWPPDLPTEGPLTIGVLGHDPFEGAMDSLKGKTVKGRRVIVKHYDDPDEALAADMLFIGASERRVLSDILKTLRGHPVLTIGDSRGFARAGVMINLVVLQRRVGFEVNVQEARRSGLRISSQLLKLSREVVKQ